MKVGDLFSWKGTVSRGEYAFIGFILFAIKYNLDRIIARALFSRNWEILHYLRPSSSATLFALSEQEKQLYLTLLVFALPFIWIGTTLTVRRLRSASLPLWLVCLFFVPVINLFFFLALSLLPEKTELQVERGRSRILDRLIPDNTIGSAALAIAVNVVSAVCLTAFSVETFRHYGWGIFVGLPFCLGFTSVLIYSYHQPRSYRSCIAVSLCSVGLVSVALLLLVFEGVICILMAAPLASILAFLGGTLGYFLQFRPRTKMDTPKMFSIAVLAIPLVITLESTSPLKPQLFETRTSVIVEAPADVVWQNVVSFAELPPPTEWIFRTGIAYPVRARIDGAGPGAVRHCVFSTGAFTEPIRIWDRPRLLKFSVTSNPPPMEEWTPYSDLQPAHLTNFLVSRSGQFALTSLSPNRTLLEGTTWYQHHMWPERYWKLWCDFIIHRIHMRVLLHVKKQAEKMYSDRRLKPAFSDAG